MDIYPLFRSALFRLDPETAHQLTLSLIGFAGRVQPVRGLLRALFHTPDDPVEVFGVRFKNRIGLAAGYDKDAYGWKGLACLGFGHVEVGTITPRAQPGNPRPRVFRLISQRAVINRMGFPGKGMEYAAHHLQGKPPYGMVVGVNIGKNKDTPLESAVDDYVTLIKTFVPLAGYLAVNVSSPNTPGLRSLQRRQALVDLLGPVNAARKEQEVQLGRKVPVLVKIAPDLNDVELDDALAAILDSGMDGVIATNTTVERPSEVIGHPRVGETGGLSGDPLMPISLRMVKEIVCRTGGKLPVVGVGGIRTPESAWRMLDAGATLVQVYTGLIYDGPGIVRRMVR